MNSRSTKQTHKPLPLYPNLNLINRNDGNDGNTFYSYYVTITTSFLLLRTLLLKGILVRIQLDMNLDMDLIHGS